MKTTQTLGLGGGCHWCTEAVFQQLKGVSNVRQGYIKSESPIDSWSEAILLDIDPAMVSFEKILDVHLATHASTVAHQRRSEYRSAVYVMNDAQMEEVKVVMSSLSRKRNKKYITQILPFADFKASRESIQDYYRTRPDAPFCVKYIEPKLEIVRKFNE
ncbi:peptide methionine sulfoxide reductase [Nonlabens sp. YIK11]|uniref:peptide-methionine (S)-S-oxide reductase n=1 Tax=Nonlabens sp. YIK11 TaxID=1453349 RepID=UPI0006DC9A0D|nr:peptide-methionine (S)-S-oxide reductase [Nonlabens sp. YIK11]KQC33178.1 peptide methionine sulfoxide reductase [Nonlabens sp. YIK11]